MDTTQTTDTPLPSNMVLCHCGKQYWNRLSRCPHCHCAAGGGRTCTAKIAALPTPVHVPLTKEQRIAHMVQIGALVPGCKGCEPLFENPDAMAPRHKASDRCQSGKRSHCTCDTCF